MTFFLDLWQDLREKRLWPVAVGLLAAAIAIPVVMLKPASDGAPTPVAVAPAPKVETLPAVNVDSSPTRNSNLKTFKQRDPFKPLSVLKKASSASSAGASGSSSSPSASSAGSSGTGSSGSTTSTSTTTTTTSPLTTPSTPSTPSTGGTTPVKWFRYTADFSFGAPDAPKTMTGVTDFTLLPDDKTAAVVFMGVSNDAKSAIFFLADPGFTPSGEGECNDPNDCRFIKLALDDKKNEETFTSLDGSVVYNLKLLQLNREFIPASQAQGDTTAKSAPRLGKGAGSTINDATETALPRLLDLGSVASQQTK
jgi:hypothetical protein